MKGTLNEILSKGPKFEENIFKAFENRKLVFFIGAGVSRIMGIMGWDDFSAFLVRKAFPDFKDNNAILRDVPSSKERITVAYKKFEQEGRLSDFYKYFGQGMIPNQKVFESKENIYEILNRFEAIFLTTNADNLFEEIIDTIINGDCIDEMQKLPDNCVDLIIADHPYNLSKGGEWKWDNSVALEGMGGNWNKVMESWDNFTSDSYVQFTFLWLKEAQRVLKPTGSMWIFGTYHNMGFVNVACQQLGIEIINEVIWYKRNAFPNLAGRRLTASHETILWCNKGGKKREYYFDYEYSKNGDFSGDGLKTPEKQMRTVWDIPNNKEKEELKYGKHPTQKPIRILKRIIKLSSHEGDIMLTPFAGSGSECVAAKMNGRKYIGFELSEEYCSIACERLKHVFFDTSEQLSLFDNSTAKRDEEE